MVALRAADGLVRLFDAVVVEERLFRIGDDALAFAIGAKAFDQSLRDDGVDGRGDKIRRDAHVDETHDAARRVVGVQGGEYQVTGDGRADGYLRRLVVTDLADHDDVGVLAQEGAETACEGHARLGVDLHLVDAEHLLLDRVLDGRDVDGGLAQLVEHRIQRRGLTRTGGARHEDDAVGRREHMVEARDGLARHPELLEAEQVLPSRVEQTHDALLAVHGGDGGDTQVHLELVVGIVEPAVLRDALLGDVHAGEDLDAGDDAGESRGGEAHDLDEVAVYTHTDDDIVLERFDVDVRRLADVRLLHEVVDQLDNGGVVDAGLDLVHFLRRVVGDEVDRLHLLLLLAVEQLRIAVVALDGAQDVLRRSEGDGRIHTRAQLDVLDDAHVLRVGDGDEDLVVVNVQRHDAVSSRKRLGHEFQHLGALDDKVFFDEGDVQALRIGGEELSVGDDAAGKQNAADVLVGVAALPAQSIAQLVMGYGAV